MMEVTPSGGGKPEAVWGHLTSAYNFDRNVIKFGEKREKSKWKIKTSDRPKRMEVSEEKRWHRNLREI